MLLASSFHKFSRDIVNLIKKLFSAFKLSLYLVCRRLRSVGAFNGLQTLQMESLVEIIARPRLLIRANIVRETCPSNFAASDLCCDSVSNIVAI